MNSNHHQHHSSTPHNEDVIGDRVPRHLLEAQHKQSKPSDAGRRTSITFELPSKEAYNMSDDKKQKAKQVAAENGVHVPPPFAQQSNTNKDQRQSWRSSSFGCCPFVSCLDTFDVRIYSRMATDKTTADYVPAPTSPNLTVSSKSSARLSSSSSLVSASRLFPAGEPFQLSLPYTSSGRSEPQEPRLLLDKPWA